MFNSRISLIKDIIGLAIPISVFNMTIVFISIANGLMLANLGNTALAAGALIGITQILVMMICTSPLFAISSLVSRMYAEKKFFEIGNFVQQGCCLAFLFSIPAIAVMFLIKPLLHLFNQPHEVIELVDLYFKSYLWGIPAAFLLTCLQQFMLGLKKTRVVTTIGIISLVLSISIGYILAFGKMGFFSWGVSGLGFAQACRSIVTLIILISYLALKKEFKVFELFIKRPINRFLQLREIFKLGWPISIHAASEYLAIFSVVIIAGRMGQLELIAQQIANQYVQFLSIPMLAFSQASNILIGNSVGNKQWAKVRQYGFTALILGGGVGLVALLSFCFYTDTLLSPYVSNDIALTFKSFLIITMCGQLLVAGKTVSIGLLRALYDTKVPMLISVVSAWGVIVPFACVTTYLLGWGINGLAIAQVCGMACCVLLLLDRWRVLSFNCSSPPAQLKTIYAKILVFGTRVTRQVMNPVNN
ncbi:MATE family efflux transporter [Legionella fairfieldensis]|uniref:MATE family efflux transporter n=1 Tax=Legionella fairfieldensis TaxID=45064 RepID=UPI000490CFCE|nr:MATE family efflux transporter [Legionella fairfieldensis]